MKKLKESVAAKVIAVILAAISFTVFAVSAAAMVWMDAEGFYQTEKDKLMKRAYDEVCYRYSILALEDYQDDFNREELSKTNFRFGVIKVKEESDGIESVDLTKESSYLVHNFDVIPKEDDLYMYDHGICEDATYFKTGSNIWDTFSIYIALDEANESREDVCQVDQYFYDRNTETLYARSGKKLFCVHTASVYANDVLYAGMYLDNSFLVQKEDKYRWYKDLQVTLDENVALYASDIKIVTSAELSKYGKVSEGEVEYIRDEKAHVAYYQAPDIDHYYVLSYVNEPLQGPMSYKEGDMFVQARLLISFIYRIRYVAILAAAASLLVFAAASVFLLCASGHYKGQEGVCAYLLDKVPVDLYFACVCGIEAALAAFALLVWDAYNPVGDGIHVFACFCTVVAWLLGVVLFLLFCMSFAVNIKLGKWYRNTCVYKICRKLWKCVRFCLCHVRSACGRFCRGVALLFGSLRLFWGAGLVLGIAAFLEFIAIVAFGYEPEMLVSFWFLEKLVLYSLVLLVLVQMDRLHQSARQIANGKLGYQVDTSRMFWDMKRHGEYLNAIRVGMNNAVNQRLKSERFKTELITNVSHDIKTPLTSIINYVDLLNKEQIENPVAQEYIEVLQRQSVRLKKLIEDLMEASKASTGNLHIEMEKCDTGVMLVQTLGEFEERLMAENIELQIKKPAESIYIEADSRHLWRVFDNLMTNICKYAQPMTRAYVNLEQDGTCALLTFRNISKCQLNISSEELMERFVRGDSSRNTEGSGLGISIAKSLTELMGGTFTLVVDGDLFKVVLSFPLYGLRAGAHDDVSADSGHDMPGSDDWKEAGSYANEFVEKVKGAGIRAKEKAGRMKRRADRFAHCFRQAAEQSKDLEK